MKEEYLTAFGGALELEASVEAAAADAAFLGGIAKPFCFCRGRELGLDGCRWHFWRGPGLGFTFFYSLARRAVGKKTDPAWTMRPLRSSSFFLARSKWSWSWSSVLLPLLPPMPVPFFSFVLVWWIIVSLHHNAFMTFWVPPYCTHSLFLERS